MFLGISEEAYKTFIKCGVDWAGKNTGRGGGNHKYDIHEAWLDKCVESGMVEHYYVNNGFATIEFIKNVSELFEPYHTTITNEFNRGVHINYISATNILQMEGYDGWSLDLAQLEGEYLDEFVAEMARIHKVRSKIKLYTDS